VALRVRVIKQIRGNDAPRPGVRRGGVHRFRKTFTECPAGTDEIESEE
jgi:hypothetical protein